MEIFIICFIIAMSCIILLIINEKHRNESIRVIQIKTEELNNRFDKLNLLGYERNIDTLNYVGFNNTDKIITIKTKGFSNKTIKYDDIAKVEFIQNGKTTLSVGNVIAGAALMGSAGAIIGGLNRNEKIVSQKIKFSLNDFNNPSYEIDLMDNGKAYEYHINLLKEIDKIVDTVKYIIENKQKINA